ncbi:hypothetical protein N7493_007493 [Penicillium malachiteum]|uniref:J domain-containing protein n=1 Tax=Penicillium malachiteum TaxID=1324776 RepID=A0AAD6HIH3_9EURO|nr:hypothetical protein N7493_007493 [Penicillium malachiteum]
MTSPQPPLNCYRVLEIPENSTVDEINAAYKRLVLLYHPDKTGGDEASTVLFHQVYELTPLSSMKVSERFIQRAVEVLRDPESRSRHDEALRSRPRITTRKTGLGNRQYFPTDDRRNWAQDERPWASTPRQNWNFNDPWERYLYTYGTGVHMDPNSEASKAERARHEHDIEDWERRYAGFDPDLERMMKNNQNEATDTVRPPKETAGNTIPAAEAKKPAKRMKAKATDDAPPHEDIGKQSTIGRDPGRTRPGVMIDLMSDMPITPTPFYSGAVNDALNDSLIDFSDSEPSPASKGRPESTERSHIDIDPASPKDETPMREDMVEAIAEKKAAEILEPFVPFFSEKLKNCSMYTASDMREEIQGLILEAHSRSLETLVQDCLADKHPFKTTSDQSCSSHSGVWERTPELLSVRNAIYLCLLSS